MKTLSNHRPLLAGLVAVALTSACAAEERSETPEAPQVAVATASLEDATSLAVRNARLPQPQLLTAGQLTEAQLDGLAEAGFENFISLRLADEDGAGWEEAYAASQSVSFTRLPVAGSDGLTLENVQELDRLLDAAGDAPTVLYCGSSNRVGALLALRAFWLDGASAEEALELGRAGGMTRLEPAVDELLAAAAVH
jgi:protein tyrosine phosphatase (PTP) superfamily phosphohydrolase (DUF442 family)